MSHTHNTPLFSEWESAVPRRYLSDLLWPLRWFKLNGFRLPPIPTYLFHQASYFEWIRIARIIKNRRIKTVVSEDLVAGNLNTIVKSIWLTFDDGWSTVWSILFPIIKTFDIKVTLFIAPELIIKSDDCRPNLYNTCNLSQLTENDFSEKPWLTWGEIKIMHNSGLVDVQSHSLHHAAVWRSDKILKRIPSSHKFRMNGLSPILLHKDKKDYLSDHLNSGDALRPLGPALLVGRRFIEPSGKETTGSWELPHSRRQRFYYDIQRAKHLIETQLDNCSVIAFAPPWAAMHSDIPQIAQDTGHKMIVLGYPFDKSWHKKSPIDVQPRLKGNTIWFYLENPILGFWGWYKSIKAHYFRNVGSDFG